MIGLLVVNIADALLNWLRTYAFAHTTSRMDAILGSQLFRHLIALPIGYFESRATGQTVARVRELENVRQFITSSALTLVIDVVFGLIFLAVMFWYSPPLTLAVVISIPFYAVISLVITPVLKARVQESSRGGARQPVVAGGKPCRHPDAEGLPQWSADAAALGRAAAGYIGASLRVVTRRRRFADGRPGQQGDQCAILWFGAQAVIANQLTIGEFVAFNMLAGQISDRCVAGAAWQ